MEQLRAPRHSAPALTAPYIHGSTDPREVARLEKQARWGAPFMLRLFDAQPGHRVLDLACGVGAMAGELFRRYPGIHLTGVDLSPTQLRSARANHAEVPVTRADGARLPFPDATFDRVHCSWLLEHVPHPVSVLREVLRVLKPGGYCHFTEVDNSTFRMAPEVPAVRITLDALNAAQQLGGGDPYVGSKLEAHFAAAGFARFHVDRSWIHGTADDATFRQGFLEEFAEIFESLDEALPHLRLTTSAAAHALRTTTGTIHYRPCVAQGWKVEAPR